ncbi:cytochrome D1 domain-containing protein [Natronospira sp.]|uniref:YVTN family beta-propeller repeat protein n=1 Tax=Natronospira sp. TaxID=2024970 RepID=UPI0038733D5C
MTKALFWQVMTAAVLLLTLSGGAGAATLVVVNKAEATVSLVDIASGEVRATLPVGEGPHEVGVSPDGRLALVGNYGVRNTPGSSLTLIDIPSARVVRTIDLGEYRRPHGIVWLGDGRRAVVTAETNKALLVVDTTTGEVVAAVDTDQEVSHMVAVTPDGGRAFVTNIRSGSVTVVDLETNTRVANIPTGEGAEGVAVTPDGATVWVTNRAADTVTVLDARTLEVVAELESPSFPIRAMATSDGRRVLVTNARSGDLSVFDVAGRSLERRMSLQVEASHVEGRLFGDTFGDSSVPIGILISPDDKLAFIAHSNADQITVVDLKSWSIAGALTAGKEPDGLGFSPHSVPVRPVNGAVMLAPRCGSKGAGGRR